MQRAIVISLCLCVAMLLGVIVQQGRLATLKNERAQVLAQISSRAETPPPVAPDKAPRVTQTSDSPSIELLKLRADVARLSNRKRELANVAVENANLQTQLASPGTNAPGTVALPAGYFKRSEAQFADYGTPEATMQTLLWAVQNRNTPNYLQAFDSNTAKQLFAQMQSNGFTEEFFKVADALPGMKIFGKENGTTPVDEAVLMVQIVPGQEPQRLRFKQFNGEWKLVGGLQLTAR